MPQPMISAKQDGGPYFLGPPCFEEPLFLSEKSPKFILKKNQLK
jgi:hypothetical protein